MDLGLRGENGLRVVAVLNKELPQTRVIGMGFILKDATLAEVLETIRSVSRGMRILPSLLTGSLFSHVVDHAIRKGNGKLPEAVRMTKREREIIVLITEAMSNKEIAQRLNLSIYTVKSHIHNILEKMALHNRLEIAAHSYQDKRL